MIKRQLLFFLLFAALAVGLRFFSFTPSVINHDESTYVVIADALLKGNNYFVEYIDTKPIGIFLLYAGFLSFFNPTIFGLRLIAAIWLALTAFILFRVQIDWGRPPKVGIAAGLIYLFLNSIYTFYGVSPNTETFFNLFTILSLWLILRRRGGWEYFLAGLILGMGFLIKYVVLFDGLAFGLFLLLEQYRRGSDWKGFKENASLLTVGFVVPFGLVFWYYYQIGNLDAFLFHTFEVPGRYPEMATFYGYFKFSLDFFLRFLPVSVFFFTAIFDRRTEDRLRLLGSLWSAAVLTVVLLPGKFFGHYFIHFMLPFSFLAAQVFYYLPEEQPRWLRWIFVRRTGYPLLGLLFGLNLYFQKIDYFEKKDTPQVVADYLEPRLTPNDEIYVGNYSQILYFLLDRSSPIRYVHPSLFWEPKHMKALEIGVEREVERIKKADPKFILVRDSLEDNRLDAFLRKNYRIAKIFKGKNVKVYEKEY